MFTGVAFNISQAHSHGSDPFLMQDCFDLDLEMEKDDIINTVSSVHNSHTTFALLSVTHV
jgi:hypothetical protein